MKTHQGTIESVAELPPLASSTAPRAEAIAPTPERFSPAEAGAPAHGLLASELEVRDAR
ncbi:MAG: hypothetical protein ACKVWV_04365 [Planctomycetota bacterium]